MCMVCVMVMAQDILEEKDHAIRPYTVYNYLSFSQTCPEFINRSMTKFCTAKYSKLIKYRYDDMMAKMEANYNVYKMDEYPGLFFVFHNIEKLKHECPTLLVHHYTLLECVKSYIYLREAVLECMPVANDLMKELMDNCINESEYKHVNKMAMFYPDMELYLNRSIANLFYDGLILFQLFYFVLWVFE